MSEPFIGEIRIFAGNFAPQGWAFTEGQLMVISQNDALFNLIGTIYGGDGQTTFALPDLRGRVPLHEGTGPGGVSRNLGERAGVEEVTLTVSQIPAHTHTLQASSGAANSQQPGGKAPAPTTLIDAYLEDESDPQNMAPQAISPVGGSQPHLNLQPFLCINFIISLFGIFPSST